MNFSKTLIGGYDQRVSDPPEEIWLHEPLLIEQRMPDLNQRQEQLLP